MQSAWENDQPKSQATRQSRLHQSQSPPGRVGRMVEEFSVQLKAEQNTLDI